MNLLHNYEVIFDWSNCLDTWDRENVAGVTIGKGGQRSIDPYWVSQASGFRFGTKTNIKDQRNEFWDSSCGVVGITYGWINPKKNTKNKKKENLQGEELLIQWDDAFEESQKSTKKKKKNDGNSEEVEVKLNHQLGSKSV
jgi:hypothetical protein